MARCPIPCESKGSRGGAKRAKMIGGVLCIKEGQNAVKSCSDVLVYKEGQNAVQFSCV